MIISCRVRSCVYNRKGRCESDYVLIDENGRCLEFRRRDKDDSGSH
ncbi:MAG: DUF1540 domain-containing protein [Candidatus Thorarchaeota archaeon]